MRSAEAFDSSTLTGFGRHLFASSPSFGSLPFAKVVLFHCDYLAFSRVPLVGYRSERNDEEDVAYDYHA
jgi:hypothetical protein